MDDEFKVKITAKGDAMGVGLFSTVLHSSIYFYLDKENPTLEEFIEFMHRKLTLMSNRAKKNSDGTLTIDDLESVYQTDRMVESYYKKYLEKHATRMDKTS